MKYVGKTFLFTYPTCFNPLPEYTEHANQFVIVKRRVPKSESDTLMYEIVAGDGWTGHAFADELEPIKRKKKD